VLRRPSPPYPPCTVTYTAARHLRKGRGPGVGVRVVGRGLVMVREVMGAQAQGAACMGGRMTRLAAVMVDNSAPVRVR